MATLEYTALALLVSLVVAVGGAVADARAIGSAVGAQVRKALCLVAGGDCLGRAGPRACVVRSRSQLAEIRVGIGVVRLRDGRSALVEELADGTFRVTVTHGGGAGAGVQLGLQVQLAGRGLDVAVDAEGGGDLSSARTFVVAGAAAARRLVERLEDEGPPVGGAIAGLVRFLRGDDGDEVERTIAVGSRGEARAALEAVGLGPSASVLQRLTGSVRVDRRTGDRGLGLRLGGEAGVAVGAALAQASGGTVSSVGAELVLDRERRPRELVLRAAGAVHGAARLRSGGVAAGDLREVEARLDLADPATRALADRLMAGDAAALSALAGRVAAQARIDVRHFAIAREEQTVGGSLLGLGGSRLTTDQTARLVAAEGREPGLGWSRRLDCGLAT